MVPSFFALGGKWAARTKAVPIQGSKAREGRWLTAGHLYWKYGWGIRPL